jgi:hypothetical protein
MDLVIHPIQFRVPAGFSDYSRYLFTRDARQLEILYGQKRGESLRTLLREYIDRSRLLIAKGKLGVGKMRPLVIDGKQGLAVTLTLRVERREKKICEFFPINKKQYIRLFYRAPAVSKSSLTELAAINRAIRIDRSRGGPRSKPHGWICYHIGPLHVSLPPDYEPPSTFFMQDKDSRLHLSMKALRPHTGLLEQQSDLELFGIPDRRAQLISSAETLVESTVRRYVLREPDPRGESVSLALTARRAAGPLTVAVLGRQRDRDEVQDARLETAVNELLQSVQASVDVRGSTEDTARLERSATAKKPRRRRAAKSNRRRPRKRQ